MELLKSAVRQLRARKLATALTLLLLAVGIGANTAIFSVVHSVLLEPLPYPGAGELALVRKVFPAGGGSPIPGGGDRVPDIEFAAWIAAVPKSFRALAGYRAGTATLEVGDDATMVPLADATGEFFPMLGVRAWRGRLPAGADFAPGAAPVAVLSHARWMSVFNGEDSAIGRVVKLDDTAHTVIGVLPPSFEFVDAADIWRPLPLAGMGRPGEMRIQLISAFGRLLPGTDHARAALELDGISERFWSNPWGGSGGQQESPPAGVRTARPENAAAPQPAPVPVAGPAPAGGTERRVEREGGPHPPGAGPMRRMFSGPFGEAKTRLVPLQEHLVQQSRATLWLLLGAVGFVLLIASANIASLQLARSEGRRRELAVRAALGASPRRLATELLAENLLLATGGGLLGVLFAWWGVRALEAWLATQLPRMSAIALDGSVLAFAVALSVGAGLLFGIAPALRARRVDLLESLKEGGHQSTRSGSRLRQGLVAVEVTLALMLAINTGLLARSVYQISSHDPGFRTDDVMTASLTLPRRYSTPAQQRDFATRWIESIRALPGVKSAALADMPPLTPYNQVMMIADSRVTTGNTDASVDAPPRRVAIATVGADYFRALGIPLREGRLFLESDDDSAPNVAIVNEAYMKAHFPTGTAVGTTIDLPFAGSHAVEERDRGATIVGIVGDVRPGGLDATSQPLAYFPTAQHPRQRLTAVVQFTGRAADLSRAVAKSVHRIDPGLAVASPSTLADQIARQNAPRRITFLLTGAFALTAVVLAALGIFGVMSYTVAQRTQEIGVRMALGADSGMILRWVMAHGGAAIGAGLLAGIALTLSTGRVLRSFMAGIETLDPLVILAAAASLALVGAIACLLPAVRAMRVSPVEALRES
jgi:putative ABC transport system permease protein